MGIWINLERTNRKGTGSMTLIDSSETRANLKRGSEKSFPRRKEALDITQA